MSEQEANAAPQENAPIAPPVEANAPDAPPAPTIPLIDPAQELALKGQLLTKLKEAYDEFWKKLMHLPASGRHVPVALQHFDTGYLWMELAIKQLTLQGVRQEAAAQPAPQPQPEENKPA